MFNDAINVVRQLTPPLSAHKRLVKWANVQKLGSLCSFCLLIANSFVTPFSVFADESQTVKLKIVSTTDFHGYLLPKKNPAGLEAGGVDIISGYYKILRNQDPETLFLDSGDLFQGTLVSNLNEGQAVIKAYTYLGYTATALGNHEFDFGPHGEHTVPLTPGEDPLGALKLRISEASEKGFHFLSANLCAPDEDPFKCQNEQRFNNPKWIQGSVIKNIRGVKVGIVGLTTPHTPEMTMPLNVKDLRFLSMIRALENQVASLQASGVNAFIVVLHAGGFCKESVCNSKDELFQLVDQISEKTRSKVIAFLGGHTHNYINTIYKGKRIIIAGSYGNSFALIDANLSLNARNNDVQLLGEPQAQIFDFCREVFSDTQNCKSGTGSVVQAKFQGEKVVADYEILDLLQYEISNANNVGKRRIGKALHPMSRSGVESAMGYFVTDGMRNCGLAQNCDPSADFAFSNAGGIRSNLPEGELTYRHIFEVMPFDNFVAKLDLSGQQLRDFISFWYTKSKKIPQFSGGQIHYSSKSIHKRIIFNGQGESFEILDPIVSILDTRGSEIRNDKKYTVLFSDFIASGGDGLGFFFYGLNPPPFIRYDLKIRDALVFFLEKNPQGISYLNAPKRIIEK